MVQRNEWGDVVTATPPGDPEPVPKWWDGKRWVRPLTTPDDRPWNWSVKLVLWLVSVPLWWLALWNLWYWFAVPVGLPQLSLLKLIGLSYVVAFLAIGPIDVRFNSAAEKNRASLLPIVKPVFFLLFGWVIHLAIGVWG
jgi:hypothetical protein